jgi:hypothetical protein
MAFEIKLQSVQSSCVTKLLPNVICMQNSIKFFPVFFAPAVQKEGNALIICYVLHAKIKRLLVSLMRFKSLFTIKLPILMLSVKHEWMNNMFRT